MLPLASAAPLRGYPADSSGPEYRRSAALACSRPNYSAGGSGVFLALRRLSPPSRKISEFSTSRSAMAVAMIVLNRMWPQSENGELVVMIVERFWL
jgi:hypothetical protein